MVKKKTAISPVLGVTPAPATKTSGRAKKGKIPPQLLPFIFKRRAAAAAKKKG